MSLANAQAQMQTNGQMPWGGLNNQVNQGPFMGNDGLLADVGAQNVSDPDLAQHAN